MSALGELLSVSVLVALVVYVGVVRFGLETKLQDSFPNQESITWQQPQALLSTFPQNITNNTYQFDYDNIELILLNSKLIQQNILQVDSDTLTLLESVTAELPEKISEFDLERVGFLISRNLPKETAKLLFTLIQQFIQYQKMYTEYQLGIQQSLKQNELSRLKNSSRILSRLQQQIFGNEVALKLFSKRNLTTNYLKRSLVNQIG